MPVMIVLSPWFNAGRRAMKDRRPLDMMSCIVIIRVR